MWTLRLALRNARRNVRRSLLTAGTVVIGVAVFVAMISFIEGMTQQMYQDTTAFIGHVRVADTDYIRRESVRPLYEFVPDAPALVAQVEAVPGVTAAYPVIVTGVALTAGDELGDVFGLAVGANPDWFERVGILDQIAEGAAPTRPGEWLLGSTLARKADAKIGDTIVAFGQTQDGGMSPMMGTLVGIVHGGTSLVDRRVFMSLGEMQEMVDIAPGAIEILVYADDLMDATAVAERITASGLTGLSAQAWTDRAPYNAMIPILSAMQAILGGALVFLTSLAIWNTMTMSVLERTAEIGVMRAMGQSGAGAVSLFVVEAAMIALIGGVIGVALGAVPALWFETYGLTLGSLSESMGDSYAIQSTIYGDLTVGMMVRGVVLGLVMAVFGSFIPSLRAATIQPVEAMRHGR